MCLSTAYIGTEESEEGRLCEYVTSVSSDGGTLRLTDISGEVVEVDGSIRSVDMIRNVIFINKAG